MSKLKLDEYFMCINVIDWQRRSDPARRMRLLLLPTTSIHLTWIPVHYLLEDFFSFSLCTLYKGYHFGRI